MSIRCHASLNASMSALEASEGLMSPSMLKFCRMTVSCARGNARGEGMS